MFRDAADGDKRARDIAEWISNHPTFKSHSRHLTRDELLRHGFVISPLEGDGKLQDLSLSVFHATAHTFTGTNAVKIVENHLGRAFIKHHLVAPQPAIQFGIEPSLPGQPPS